MKVPRNVNDTRRKVMRSLTQKIGKTPMDFGGQSLVAGNVKRILVCRPNHRLGNQLLLTPLIQELAATFPNATIDLFVRGGLSPIIFKNYPEVGKIIQLPKKPFKQLLHYLSVWVQLRSEKYDLAINVDSNSSSGRLSTRFSNAKYKYFGLDSELDIVRNSEYRHMAKAPVYGLRSFLNLFGVASRNSEIPLLQLRLSKEEKQNGLVLLHNLVPTSPKIICLYTYATGDKCYTGTWWLPFYEQLKKQFPNYAIIELLPLENVSQIDFAAPHFYSKDIREMGSIIANTAIFIAADSGVMHLAASVGVPVIGLFSVTDPQKYAPYGNNSCGITTNTTEFSEILKVIDGILT